MMEYNKNISMNERVAALDKMRENLRGQAQKNAELYREFCGEPPGDVLETGMNALWLQSVTDGNEAYKIYLVSSLWKIISHDVLLRDRHTCQACKRDAEVVHHRSYGYAVMAGLDDNQLISLCNPCHNYIHFSKMKKIPYAKWEKRLHALKKIFAKKHKRQPA